MELGLSLKEHGIEPNGVIHIGAAKGALAKYYHGEGVFKVMWVEKNQKLFKELYQNTAPYAMEQQRYIAELAAHDEVGGCQRFKTFWRTNSADIDIETYDMLNLDISSELGSVIEGFEDFIDLMKTVILRQGLPRDIVDPKLKALGYVPVIETYEHAIYQKS